MSAECVVLWGFLGLMNVVAFVVARHDKKVAVARHSKKRAARVSERALWALAGLGGGVGGLFAFLRYRHKTRKYGFMAVFLLALAVGYAAWWGWLGLLGCLPGQ